MKPQATAGRIVHYYQQDGPVDYGPTAAIVNRDTHEDGEAELTVFDSDCPTTVGFVPYAESPTPGHWSWMPYQKQKAEQAGGNQSESAEPRPEQESPPDGDGQ